MLRVKYKDDIRYEHYTLSNRQPTPTPYKDCPSSSPSPPPTRPQTPVGSPVSPASSTTIESPHLSPREEKTEEEACDYILPKISSPRTISPWSSEDEIYMYEGDDEREKEAENKKTVEGSKVNVKREVEDIEPENPPKRNKSLQYLQEIDEIFNTLASVFEEKREKDEEGSKQEYSENDKTGKNPVGMVNEICQKSKNKAIYEFKEIDRVFYCHLEVSGKKFHGEDKKKKSAKAKAAKEFIQYLAEVKDNIK